MRKEPWGLYLFRFMSVVGLFVFMGMLYWSSLLVEEDLKGIRADFVELKSELYHLRQETGEIRSDVMRRSLLQPVEIEGSGEMASTDRPHIDPNLPNLLEEDPFYAKTLPKIVGKGFFPHGTFHQGTVFKPESLAPFGSWYEVSNWYSLCLFSVATNQFGKFETLAPSAAIKMEERPRIGKPGVEYWIHLRDNLYWQPLKQEFFPEGPKLAPHFLQKHPVTAHDFKFYYDALFNSFNEERGAVARRIYLEEIDEVEVVDDHTFVVRWGAQEVKQPDGSAIPKVRYSAKFTTGGSLIPLPSFVYKYFADGTKIIPNDEDPDTYMKNSVWAQNFSQHWAKNIIVSCGAWVFDGMTDQQIRFRRNPDYFNPLEALMTERSVFFKSMGDAVWQDFKSGHFETHELIPDQLAEYRQFLESDQYKAQKERGEAVKNLDYTRNMYNYIGWNQATPYFQSRKVRRAMTMAIDRRRIIEQFLQGMGREIATTFSPFSPANNKAITPWPYDPIQAKALLQEEGWYDSDGDGIIDKEIDGKRVPFRFQLTYYVKNQTTKSIAEYVATALKEVGVDCVLHGVDIADLSAALDSKNFDAIYMGWALGSPPEDPGQLWHSKGAKEPGSSNSVGFANEEVDQIIEQLRFEDNREKRIQLYHRFCEIIHEEAPYTFLFNPKVSLLYREKVQNVFVPAERQDLIPGATVFEPSSTVFFYKKG